MDTKPETVFKYERLSMLSLQNLKKHSVYFASPTQFNNPYDCKITAKIDDPTDEEIEELRSHFISDPESPEGLREQLSSIDSAELRTMLVRSVKASVLDEMGKFLTGSGVTCLAERNDNLLMWSHYASNHSGFCLEFRTEFDPFRKLRCVKYVESMPRVNLCDFYIRNKWRDLMDLYCTKSSAWEYEREWRVLHKEAGTLYSYEPDALKAVYFGPEMERQTKEIICLILAGQNPNVELWQVERVTDRFDLTFEQFTYTSHAEAKRQGLL